MTHLSVTEVVPATNDPRPTGGEHVTDEKYHQR